MRKTSLVLGLAFASSILFGQDSFTLKMNMKTEGLPAEYAAYGEFEITTQVKGDKVKTEMVGMMNSNTQYYDGNKVIFLNDAMGNKTGYTTTKSEIESLSKEDKNEPKPKVEYTNEKKMIAGYECSKAIVTSKSKDGTEIKITIWLTEKIRKVKSGGSGKGGGMNMSFLEDLKGQVLEMEMPVTAQGMNMVVRMTTTEVSTTALDDALFVPNTDGYKMMSYKEMMEQAKAMGGK